MLAEGIGGTGHSTPSRGPSHCGRRWSHFEQSSLFLEVKNTPTFTSYFLSPGLGFCGCTLSRLHNLGLVSLWRENTEDLVTRRWGASKETGRVKSVYSASFAGIWEDRKGRVQPGSDDDWFHFGHWDHTTFGGCKIGAVGTYIVHQLGREYNYAAIDWMNTKIVIYGGFRDILLCKMFSISQIFYNEYLVLSFEK